MRNDARQRPPIRDLGDPAYTPPDPPKGSAIALARKLYFDQTGQRPHAPLTVADHRLAMLIAAERADAMRQAIGRRGFDALQRDRQEFAAAAIEKIQLDIAQSLACPCSWCADCIDRMIEHVTEEQAEAAVAAQDAEDEEPSR